MSKKKLVGKNIQRGQWGAVALETFGKTIASECSSYEETMADLFADVMHFAEAEGIDVDQAWESAQEHYLHERDNPHE